MKKGLTGEEMFFLYLFTAIGLIMLSLILITAIQENTSFCEYHTFSSCYYHPLKDRCYCEGQEINPYELQGRGILALDIDSIIYNTS